MAGKSPAKKEQSQPLLPEQVEKPKLSWASTNMWPVAVAISLTTFPAGAIYFGVQKIRDWRKKKAYKSKLNKAYEAQGNKGQSQSNPHGANQGGDNLGPMQPAQSQGQGHSQSNNTQHANNDPGSQARQNNNQKAEEDQKKKEEYQKGFGYWVRQNKLTCSAIVFGAMFMGGAGVVVGAIMVGAAYYNKRQERKWKQKHNPQLKEYQQNSFYNNERFRYNLANNKSQSQVQDRGGAGQVQNSGKFIQDDYPPQVKSNASNMQDILVAQPGMLTQPGRGASIAAQKAKSVNKAPGQTVS